MLIDHVFQSVKPLNNPQSFAFVVLFQLFLRSSSFWEFYVDIGDVISDPSDVQQADDVGHAA